MNTSEDPNQCAAHRTLVIHAGGIGDFLLACPALSALPRTTSIDLCGYADRLNLAVEAGIANCAFSFDAIDLHSGFTEPSSRLVELIRDYDRVILWMRDADSLAANLRSCGVPQVDAFPGLPPEDWSRHVTEYYAECLDVTVDPDWRLDIAAEGQPLDVVIHPGSGSSTKNWPLDRFDEVASELATQGRTVTWIAGPAEVEGGLAKPGLLVESSLVSLAKQLAAARLYVGNDSGITHLAASLGVATIAIFGPTDPGVWGPRGERVQIVRDRPWPGVEKVMRAIEQFEV